MKLGELKKIVVDSLELNEVQDTESINEAYIATPKTFKLSTELISTKTKIAHEQLYEQYIEKLNRVSAELDTADRSKADSKASSFRSLKLIEASNRNAAYLHELYFANISDQQSEVSFDSLSYMKLSKDFGTFDDWQWDFIACALSANNGWAMTVYDSYLRRYRNVIIDGNDVAVPVGCFPVLVLDVVEHSYFRDYQNDKKQYITNMMREINWSVVEKRIYKTEMISKVLEQRI